MFIIASLVLLSPAASLDMHEYFTSCKSVCLIFFYFSHPAADARHSRKSLPACVPLQLTAIAGPAIAAITAKANKKIGISNVIMTGEDYNWVCPCDAFPGMPLDEKFIKATDQGEKCPHDASMGCAKWIPGYTPSTKANADTDKSK